MMGPYTNKSQKLAQPCAMMPAQHAASLPHSLVTKCTCTCVATGMALWPQPSSPAHFCGCACADCRALCCDWFRAAVPLLRLTFCIQGYPSCFMFLRGLPSWRVPRSCVADADAAAEKQRKSVETRFFLPGVFIFQKLTTLGASLAYSAWSLR